MMPLLTVFVALITARDELCDDVWAADERYEVCRPHNAPRASHGAGGSAGRAGVVSGTSVVKRGGRDGAHLASVHDQFRQFR